MNFAGHERDLGNLSSAVDDLDYMHARFYNLQVARFLSVDPKSHYMPLKVPQTWNRYAYASGNPLIFTDPDGRDVKYANKDDQNFFEKAAARNWRVRAVLNAFAPGTGRDLNIVRGDPGVHPTTKLPLAASTESAIREAKPEELRTAYDAAAVQGGDKAGTAAAQALLDQGVQLHESTIILTSQTTPHEKLHELGHVEQALNDPEGAKRDADEARKAPTDRDYKRSNAEEYAEDFAEYAKKKRPDE